MPLCCTTPLKAEKLSSHLRGILTLSAVMDAPSTSSPQPVNQVWMSCALSILFTDAAAVTVRVLM